MFTSLQRVTYRVPDVTQAGLWYRRLLGREPLVDSPFIVLFQLDQAVLALVPLPAGVTGGGSPGGQTAYWQVEDVEAVRQALLAAGAGPGDEMVTVVNQRVATVIDPFGNRIGICGPVPAADRQTVHKEPSQSARTVAFCRALAAAEEDPARRGPDNLAVIFLDEETRRPLGDAASRQWVIQKLVTPGLYGYFFARTAYLDAAFRAAIQSNLAQVLFLGAGYDSRSYRLTGGIRDTRIFELDSRPTQERKRQRLSEAGVPIPEQVTFVPIDFASQKFEDVLPAAGFDPRKPSLFIWEGVSYYLEAEAVENTLDFVAANAPAGSQLCFDYMCMETPSTYAGEPFRFWLPQEDMEGFLARHGLELVEHLSPEDIQREVLTAADGSPLGSTLPMFCFVRASVTG